MKTINNLFTRLAFSAMVLALIFSSCEKEKDEDFIHIPDDAFLSALIQVGVDTDGDEKISREEAEAVSYLDIANLPVASMEGIEGFVNLDTLICYGTGISNLDVSKNTSLIFLNCALNSISSLEVSNNTKLTFLSCYQNELTTLDVSENVALTRIDCNFNQLSSLDVSSNTALSQLSCAVNSITSLDVSNNSSLTQLDVSENQLASLEVSANTALIKLFCSENQLTRLDVSNNTALTELDLRKMPSLEQVCVWTLPFPPAEVSVYTSESPNVFFDTDCGM